MAMLRLYNTLTRTKEPFAPIDPANVRMYACGPTVYDYAHIGNARPVIVFDLLFRLLRHLYGADHVAYVRNVTDVDDKINARAAERGVSIRDLTEGTLKQFHADIRALGVLMPDDVNEPGKPPRFVEPRATEHIAEMKALIERLVANGHAYVAEDNVLFHVPSMPDYGALSKRPLDEMEAGARVDVAPYKRSPLDFVLWKPSKPGEPAWPSPCGVVAPGRPGWHIECSAMSWKHLGETFDIHAGGIDLVFPHHENEIAQSRCCFGAPVMANVWLHNGFLQVEGEKMAKSAGNFVTIHELLATDKFGGRRWRGEVLRLAMLRTHYRQPIDWRSDILKETEDELSEWASLFLNADHGRIFELAVARFSPDSAVLAALQDDLNTPTAIMRLRELYRGARTDKDLSINLLHSCWLLGLLNPRKLGTHMPGAVAGPGLLSRFRSAVEMLKTARANNDIQTLHSTSEFVGKWGVKVDFDEISYPILTSPQSDDAIEARIEARTAARAAKDWAESDRIRDELKAMGVVLHDNKDGTTTWEVAR